MPSTCRITELHLNPKNVVLELVTIPEILRRVVLGGGVLSVLEPLGPIKSRKTKSPNPKHISGELVCHFSIKK